jgi:hypothetical protein
VRGENSLMLAIAPAATLPDHARAPDPTPLE